jgi:hypothetical protein
LIGIVSRTEKSYGKLSVRVIDKEGKIFLPLFQLGMENFMFKAKI